MPTNSMLCRLSVVGCLVIGTSLALADEIRVPRDHATIQAAVDDASAGDVVLVEAGTYRERIVLKPHVTLRSAGGDAMSKRGMKRAAATIIDGDFEGAKGAGVTMAEGAVLDGFTVTNVGTYDDAEWQKHWETRGEEQKHEHIGHFGTPGIGIVGVTCVVRHCIVHHNGDTGIAVRGAGEQEPRKDCSPLVAHNVTHRNMGGGIGSMLGSTAVIEHNVCFENFFAGIGHDGASPIVRHNECYGNVRAGIGISEGACPVVRENACYGNRRAGIGTRTGADTQPVIERNECYENGMAGIGSEHDVRPIIRGNRCHHNALAGIGSRHHAEPIIVDNECWENGEAGIGSRDGAHPVIVRNTSRENGSAGIGVRSTGTKAVLVDNRCIDNKLVALGLPDGASAVVVGNHLERKGGVPPLVAVKGGSSAVVIDNELRGGGVATLLVEGRVSIGGNVFHADVPGRGTGVWLWKGSDAVVVGNRFDGHQTRVKPSPDVDLVERENVEAESAESREP